MVYLGTFSPAEIDTTFTPVNKHTLSTPESHEPRSLPTGFQPSEGSVICGKGKQSYQHSGNKRFRQLCEQKLDQYASAKTRLEKSLIVRSIIDAVQAAAPGGGFVKQDPSTGCWYEVSNDVAREKIGQHMRESLCRKDPIKRNARKEQRKPKALRSSSVMPMSQKKDSVSFLEPTPLVTRSLEDEWQNQDVCELRTFARAQSDSMLLPPRKGINFGLTSMFQSRDDADIDWCSLEAAASIFLQHPTSATLAPELARSNQDAEIYLEPPALAKAQSDTVLLPPRKELGLHDTSLSWNRVEAPSLIFDKGFHPFVPSLADRVCNALSSSEHCTLQRSYHDKDRVEGYDDLFDI